MEYFLFPRAGAFISLANFVHDGGGQEICMFCMIFLLIDEFKNALFGPIGLALSFLFSEHALKISL